MKSDYIYCIICVSVLVLVAAIVLVCFYVPKYLLRYSETDEQQNYIYIGNQYVYIPKNIKWLYWQERYIKEYERVPKNFRMYVDNNSMGLWNDANIFIDAVFDKYALPVVHFEQYAKNAPLGEWLVANLDITKFENMIDTPRTLLCKTLQTYEILTSHPLTKHHRLYYTGFTSVDKYTPEVEKDFHKFIHIPGKSPYKNTNGVITVWEKHPEWPLLTIIGRQGTVRKTKAKNINVISRFLDEQELRVIMNNHGVHICPSAHEGFGHYLNEARSTGAVVMYTDAPPMNEFCQDGITGISIQAYLKDTINFTICPRYAFHTRDFEKAMHRVLSMNDKDMKTISNNTRDAYVKGKKTFTSNINSLLQSPSIPKIIHQIWIKKGDEYSNYPVPSEYENHIASIKKHHPDFSIKFWSGKDVHNFIKEHFPTWISFYENITSTICKCNIARFLIVYIYGGVYVDLDFYFRKNISPVLKQETYFLFEPKERMDTFKNIAILNKLFGSVKKHPFIKSWLENILSSKETNMTLRTGPVGLYKCYKNYNGTVFIGDTCAFFSIVKGTGISLECKNGINHSLGTVSIREGFERQYKKDRPETVKNPITGEQMYWIGDFTFDKNRLKQTTDLYYMLYNKNSDKKITLHDPDVFSLIVATHALEHGNCAIPRRAHIVSNHTSKIDSDTVKQLALMNNISNMYSYIIKL